MLGDNTVDEIPSDDVLETERPSQLDCRVEAITCDQVVGSASPASIEALKGGLVLSIGGQPCATIYPAAFPTSVRVAGSEERAFFGMRLPVDLNDTHERPVVEVALASTGTVLPNGSRKPLPRARKARALVLIPAGARYEHDKVRIHNWPMDRVIDTYVNIGDLMVYDSTLKLLDFETIEIGNIVSFTDKDVDRYNAEFDFAFLRGSNFIHEYMKWERAGELIERLKMPVFAIGVGAQAAHRQMITLPQEAKRVWSAIADHCGAIGVRGSYSAEVLAHNGIRNVEVVGCPSIFRKRSPDLHLNLKPIYDIRKIAFSLRRETSGNYARDIKTFVDVQRRFMLRLDDESDMTVTLHGEPEEKAFFFKDIERIEKATARLRASSWFDGDTEERLKHIYKRQLFFNTTVEQYDDFIGTQDLAIGYRVHGILPALANGVPGILVNYDERSAELAETYRIPMVDEERLSTASWRDLYTPDLFKPFLEVYPQRYRAMQQFLKRNGVPNRL